jgi:hypothetical protein
LAAVALEVLEDLVGVAAAAEEQCEVAEAEEAEVQ